MRVRAVTLVPAFIAAMSAAGASAAPLDEFLPRRAGASACYVRAYDDTHLRQNPRQKTTFIAAWMKYEKARAGDGLALSVSLAIRRRGERDALFSQGTCEWKADANRDSSNNRLIATFPKDEGAICLQFARPDVFDLISA